jgi:hypothetical protein
VQSRSLPPPPGAGLDPAARAPIALTPPAAQGPAPRAPRGPVDTSQNTDSFIEVDEVTLQGEVRRIFTGWVFAASPGLHAVEHPIYDIWLTDCKNPVVTAETPAITAPAAAAPAQPPRNPPPAQQPRQKQAPKQQQTQQGLPPIR